MLRLRGGSLWLVHLCVCIHLFTIPLLMCARALSLSFSENLFHPKHRVRRKKDLPKKKPVSNPYACTLYTRTHAANLWRCVMWLQALYFNSTEKHKPKKLAGEDEIKRAYESKYENTHTLAGATCDSGIAKLPSKREWERMFVMVLYEC